MRIRTIKYIIKEGFVNIYKNKLMSLASLSVVFASLMIFGIFFLLIFNLYINTNALKQQPHLRVVCNEYLADFEVAEIGKVIEASGYANKIEFVSREDGLEQLKEWLEDDADVLDWMDESVVSPAYIVELKDPEMSAQIAEEIKELHGVEKVEYSQRTINLIVGISKWIQIISVILFLILFVVTIFIISNTIKLTIYARRKEISIMKYIGATDWFIRWPFIVEGMLIGVIGAVGAFILTSYVYRSLEQWFNAELVNIGNELLRIATVNEVGMPLMIFYATLGVIVGALGSTLSLRRHLKV
jgi:cell division transport system permease protein